MRLFNVSNCVKNNHKILACCQKITDIELLEISRLATRRRLMTQIVRRNNVSLLVIRHYSIDNRGTEMIENVRLQNATKR